MLGADVAALDDLATRFGVAAEDLENVERRIRGGLHRAGWRGARAERYRGEWDAFHAPNLHRTAAALRTAAHQLHAEANAQRRASGDAAKAWSMPVSGGGGGGGGSSSPGFFESIGKRLDGITKELSEIPGDVDSWLDRNAEVVNAVSDVVSDISSVLGVLAIVAAPVPPLAVGLAVGSVLLSGVALGGHYVADKHGAKVSKLTYASDVVGLVTFGTGGGAKLAMKSIGVTIKRYEAAGLPGGVRIATQEFDKWKKVDDVGEAVDLGVDSFARGYDVGERLVKGEPLSDWLPQYTKEPKNVGDYVQAGGLGFAPMAFANAVDRGMKADRERLGVE